MGLQYGESGWCPVRDYTCNTSLDTNGCSYRDYVLVLAPVGDWMLRLHIMSLHIDSEI